MKSYKDYYQVRQVKSGLWTYDIYLRNSPPEFSVGEHKDRESANTAAKNEVTRRIEEMTK